MAFPWTFAQLAGPKDVKELSGWQAPFGRPRQGTIVNAGTTVRRTVTFYPDADAPVPPTVHAFGTEPKPFELHGRWMDRAIKAAGGAQNYVRQWKDFINAKQIVRAKWGNVLSFQIFIHDFDANFESDAHVVWKLTADTLVDEQGPVAIHPTPAQTPIDMATQLRDLLAQGTPDLAAQIRAFQGQLGNTLHDLEASLVDPFLQVWNTANALSDFESSLGGDLNAMDYNLQIIAQAVVDIRDTTTAIVTGVPLQNELNVDQPTGLYSAADITQVSSDKISGDANITNLLALIADMRNEIAKATRGEQHSAVVAQDGDSWSNLATRLYGDPSGARALKGANGIRYGQVPQPGKTYSVPARA